jgi:hypothetical protein
MTCAADGYLKVWTLNGENKATVNINHPLPLSWSLSEQNRQKFK